MTEIMVSEIDVKVIERLKLFIDRLPSPERDRPILFLGDRLFSWKDILDEFNKGGKLADSIVTKLMEITK